MANAHQAYVTRRHFAVNRSSLLHPLEVVKPNAHSKTLTISIVKKIYVIYLFECDLYKIQYAGSSETLLISVLLILEKRLKTQTQN